MPTQQHTHRLPTALRTTETPTPRLRETGLLRGDVLAGRVRRSGSSLRHALVDVLHQGVADLGAAFGLVDALQDGRHFRLPY